MKAARHDATNRLIPTLCEFSRTLAASRYGNRLPVGFGDIGEVAAERRHHGHEFAPRRRLVDAWEAASRMMILPTIVVSTPRPAKYWLPGDAVQRLINDVGNIDDEIGPHAGFDRANLAVEVHLRRRC
jgi:hypothetical protein